MTKSHRRMRRYARQIRRSGMQPMMVVNSGDDFPETVAVILLRSAWRYRSELAPLGWASIVIGVALWLHAAHPHWWAFLLGIAAATAWALVAFGARMNEAPRTTRTAVRGHGRARGGRVDRRRHGTRPDRVAASAVAGHRHAYPVGALVGEPSQARQDPR